METHASFPETLVGFAVLLLVLAEDYIYREYMLCLALVLCLYTLVIHPLILQAFLKRQNLEQQG